MPTLQQTVAAFLRAKQADDCKPSTITWYCKELQPFIDYCAADASRNWRQRPTVLAYLAGLRQQSTLYHAHPKRPSAQGRLSAATRRGRHTALRALFNWLVRTGQLDASPLAGVKKPPRPQKHKKAMAPDDFRRMLDNADRFRDRAILILMAGTGARVDEVRTLRTHQIDLHHRTITLIGKRDKSRTLPLPDAVHSILCAWLPVRDGNDDYVFHTAEGQPFSADGNGIYQIFKRLARRARISGPWNPHSLRHMFGTTHVEAGTDLETLRILMGHESILTTQEYLHLSDQAVAASQNANSPAARLLTPADLPAPTTPPMTGAPGGVDWAENVGDILH